MMIATQEGLAVTMASGMLVGFGIAMILMSIAESLRRRRRRRRVEYDPYTDPDNWG